jgi:translation initiation factor IF-2
MSRGRRARHPRWDATRRAEGTASRAKTLRAPREHARAQGRADAPRTSRTHAGAESRTRRVAGRRRGPSAGPRAGRAQGRVGVGTGHAEAGWGERASRGPRRATTPWPRAEAAPRRAPGVSQGRANRGGREPGRARWSAASAPGRARVGAPRQGTPWPGGSAPGPGGEGVCRAQGAEPGTRRAGAEALRVRRPSFKPRHARVSTPGWASAPQGAEAGPRHGQPRRDRGRGHAAPGRHGGAKAPRAMGAPRRDGRAWSRGRDRAQSRGPRRAGRAGQQRAGRQAGRGARGGGGIGEEGDGGELTTRTKMTRAGRLQGGCGRFGGERSEPRKREESGRRGRDEQGWLQGLQAGPTWGGGGWATAQRARARGERGELLGAARPRAGGGGGGSAGPPHDPELGREPASRPRRGGGARGPREKGGRARWAARGGNASPRERGEKEKGKGKGFFPF